MTNLHRNKFYDPYINLCFRRCIILVSRSNYQYSTVKFDELYSIIYIMFKIRTFYPKYIILVFLLSVFKTNILCQTQKGKGTQIVVCSTDDCQRHADSIKKSINPRVKPCDDFYGHACGNWEKWHTIPKNVMRFRNPNIVADRTFNRLRQLLEEPSRPSESSIVTKTKQLYKACMDTAAQDKAGIKPLLEVIDSLGGWPIIMSNSDYAKSQVAWDIVHFKYARMTGEGSLISINVQEDPFSALHRRIYVDQPTHIFDPLKLLIHEDSTHHYKTFITAFIFVFAQAKGNKATPDNIKKDIDDVIAFRKRIYQMMAHGDDSRDERKMHHLRTIEQLKEWNKNLIRSAKGIMVNWLRLIKETFAFVKGVNIQESQLLIVKETQYLSSLITLLADTPHRVIVNHIHLYFVEKHLKHTSSAMKKLMSDMYKETTKKELEQRRWKVCIHNNQMKYVLSRMYVIKYFPKSSKTAIQNLITYLKDTMIKQLRKSSWLEATTKEQAILKIENLNVFIGYHDWLLDEAKLTAYYHDQVVGNNNFRNVISYEQNEYAKDLGTLIAPRPTETESEYAYEVNGYYTPESNSIELQAALLQSPMYSPAVPDVVTYASTGYIIAHEMSHALGVSGRHYNFRGELVDWWTPKSLILYDTKINCMLQQYSRYSARDIPPQWSRVAYTIDEDFADISGANISLSAYLEKARLNKKITTKLPGMERYSDLQLFFYSYAYQYCEYTNPKYIVNVAYSDVHSLPRLRVNGPLTNLPEFSRAFQCSPKSLMNPQKKCTIW